MSSKTSEEASYEVVAWTAGFNNKPFPYFVGSDFRVNYEQGRVAGNAFPISSRQNDTPDNNAGLGFAGLFIIAIIAPMFTIPTAIFYGNFLNYCSDCSRFNKIVENFGEVMFIFLIIIIEETILFALLYHLFSRGPAIFVAVLASIYMGVCYFIASHVVFSDHGVDILNTNVSYRFILGWSIFIITFFVVRYMKKTGYRFSFLSPAQELMSICFYMIVATIGVWLFIVWRSREWTFDVLETASSPEMGMIAVSMATIAILPLVKMVLKKPNKHRSNYAFKLEVDALIYLIIGSFVGYAVLEIAIIMFFNIPGLLDYLRGDPDYTTFTEFSAFLTSTGGIFWFAPIWVPLGLVVYVFAIARVRQARTLQARQPSVSS